jgi:polyisoprenoid-binding protein YceI
VDVKRSSFLAVLAAVVAGAGVAQAAPTTFQIDRAHSEVGFNIRHIFNKVHGRFTDFDGTIVYDPSNLTASTVAVTIRDSSINTANERRDNHLRTQDFFWADKYPTIAFKSSKVTPGPDSSHFQVAGDLTIRGITKPVTLNVEVLGMAPVSLGPNFSSVQAGFVATTTVARKDWEIVWNKQMDQGGMMLGDDVDLVLNIAAQSAAPRPAGGAAAGASKAAH